ncbi:hypothetical protein ABZ914_03865 [Spirillospora sp. NPDC046719]
MGGPHPREDPASAARWLDFAATVAAAGCRLTVIIPYPEHRRPAWTANLNPITWDGSNTTGDLTDLTALLSIATRIEPELIRAIRLELLPEPGAAAEADLWFSPWVAARTPGAIAFFPDVLPQLRSRLQPDDQRAQRAFEITTTLHQNLTPALLLEEQLTGTASPQTRTSQNKTSTRFCTASSRSTRTSSAWRPGFSTRQREPIRRSARPRRYG